MNDYIFKTILFLLISFSLNQTFILLNKILNIKKHVCLSSSLFFWFQQKQKQGKIGKGIQAGQEHVFQRPKNGR